MNNRLNYILINHITQDTDWVDGKTEYDDSGIPKNFLSTIFLKKYENVEGFTVYGNDNYKAQYISQTYPEDEIKFDIKKIRLVFQRSHNNCLAISSLAHNLRVLTVFHIKLVVTKILYYLSIFFL